MTALWAHKNFPKEKITIIESDQIGILGAGEGTVPAVLDFFKSLEIELGELIAKTRGSLKLGIDFENWNGDGKRYYHSFLSKKLSIPENFSNNLFLYEINTNDSIQSVNDYLTASKYCEESKVPFYKTEDSYDFDPDTGIAIHFDAHKIASFLREKAEERGVIRVEGISDQIILDSNGNVSQIKLTNGSVVDCDFVFDCSGFHRKIIGEVYNTKWVSYSDYLPMKKAIPYFPKQKEEVIPYTRSIAMKYGWQWQIPLMDRFGAGYVFDSDFITPDQAKDELDQWVGHEVESPRVIEFNAGRYNDTWVKNCIAIGLSTGFIEPLEATAIWTATSSLELLTNYVPYILNAEEKMKAVYNERVANGNENTLAFIYFHYLTKRTDTEFWRGFRENTKTPKVIESLLEEIECCPIDNQLLSEINSASITMFEDNSWVQVGFGLDYFNKSMYRQRCDYYEISKHMTPQLKVIENVIANRVQNSFSHREFLNLLEKKCV